MSGVRRSARVVAVLAAALLPLTGCATTAAQPAAPPGAQAANDEAVLSPLAVVPLGEVNPVLGRQPPAPGLRTAARQPVELNGAVEQRRNP